MPYERLNIKNGDVINDYHINYLQDAISKIASDEKSFRERLATTLIRKGVNAASNETFDTLLSKIDSLPNNREKEPEIVWPDIRENIQSGHIRLLVKTGTYVEFFVQATTAATFIVNWGDKIVTRYYVPSGGSWLKKEILASVGENVEGQNYKVTTVDISLDVEDGAICRFQAPGNDYRHNLLWFCSKDIIFTSGSKMFNNNTALPCTNLKYIDLIGGSINGDLNCFAQNCNSLERINASFIPGNNSVVQAFNGCSKLKEPPTINLENATNANYLFNGCSQITEFNYYIKNNGSITNAAYMFSGCTNLQRFYTNQQFDFSSVSEQYNCFSGCNNLVTAPNIIFGRGSASNFFRECTKLTTVQREIIANDVSTIDSFFYKCLSLVNGPSNFTAINATNINSLFDECTSIQAVPTVINFPSATTAWYLFRNCYKLNKAPTLIDLPAATEIRDMFMGCVSLTIPPNTIRANSAKNAYRLFSGCNMLVNAPQTIELGVATHIAETFYNCSSLIKGPDRYYAPNAIDAGNFFCGCALLENAGAHFEIGNKAPAQCTFLNFFKYCRKLTTLPTEGDMHQGWCYQDFFNETNNITKESFKNFCEKGLSFPKATTFQGMFMNSNVINIPDISAPLCTSTYGMFQSVNKLESLGNMYIPLSNNVNLMFRNGGSSVLDLGELDLSSMITNNGDFNGLTNIKKLTLVGLRTNFWLNNAKNLTSVILKNPRAEFIGNLEFKNCGMDGNALNALLESLPDRQGMSNKLTIFITGNPGVQDCDENIGIRKNWTVTK